MLVSKLGIKKLRSGETLREVSQGRGVRNEFGSLVELKKANVAQVQSDGEDSSR
jgi:hypothetical protein